MSVKGKTIIHSKNTNIQTNDIEFLPIQNNENEKTIQHKGFIEKNKVFTTNPTEIVNGFIIHNKKIENKQTDTNETEKPMVVGGTVLHIKKDNGPLVTHNKKFSTAVKDAETPYVNTFDNKNVFTHKDNTIKKEKPPTNEFTEKEPKIETDNIIVTELINSNEESDENTILFDNLIKYNEEEIIESEKTITTSTSKEIKVEINEIKTMSTLRKRFKNDIVLIIDDILNDETDFEEFPIHFKIKDINVIDGEDNFINKTNKKEFTLKSPIPKAISYLISKLLGVTQTMGYDIKKITEMLIETRKSANSTEEWLILLKTLWLELKKQKKV